MEFVTKTTENGAYETEERRKKLARIGSFAFGQNQHRTR